MLAGGASSPHAVVIGAGFCGLAAAWELGRHGVRVTVLEQDSDIGGLAGSFTVGGTQVEKFYHHWYPHDVHVTTLVEALGQADRMLLRPARTGMYYAHNFFGISSPADLLRLSPLPFLDRLLLGLLVFRVRRVRDWRSLEDLTAVDWLRALAGERVYRVVWEPLLQAKFGELKEEVAAVWLWSRIKLRTQRGGARQLAYYRGGFGALAEALADAIRARNGTVRVGLPAEGLQVDGGQVTGVVTREGAVAADAVVATPALPIVADLLEPHVPGDYVERLRRIRYLGNVCIVLELDRTLSDYYWLNVNDPGFPFAGVIEHTRLEPASTYGGRHLVYLSRYLPETDTLYRMPDQAVAAFALDHLRRMFPDLASDRVVRTHVWRAPHAQPVVECGYRRMIPERRTPLANLFLETMAQIYPEDRGTSLAIRNGREIGRTVAATLGAAAPQRAPEDRTEHEHP